MCFGLKSDVDSIQLTSRAARFRVASRSAKLSAGMTRTRAAEDHCGWTRDSFAMGWDDKYFRTSTAYCTTSAFKLVGGMDSLRRLLRSAGPQDAIRVCYHVTAKRTTFSSVLGSVNLHRVLLLMKDLCHTANSCKPGLVVGATRSACNGLYTATRFHTAEENCRTHLGML